ncbi:MAG: WD40 repeat domain-containing protein, partial [Acidimicrobiales bacterium]|nr:WD40 repeat domain-containing protein [Acidimicrobiales bacterium]
MLMHKIRTALVVTGAVFAVYQGIDLQAQPVPNEQPKPVANVPLGPAQPQGSKATDDPRTTLPWLPWPSLGVSADGSRVVAPLSSQFNQVRIDLASGERKTLPESAIDPMFTPDGSLMLTTNGVLWDVKTWSKVRIFKAEEQRQVSCCCFSHDFKYIVTGSEDKTVRVWDARTGKELAKLVGHNDWVTAVAIDGRNKLVISGSKDRTARIWDWKSGEHLHSLPEEDILRVVAFGASGRRAVTLGWLSSARIWDTETGEQVALLKNTHGWKYAIIDPNGFRVVTYGHGYRREVARVWNIEDGRHLYSLEDPESVRFARFDHSGNRLVAGGEKTCVWDAKSGRRLVTLEDADGLRKACFSPDGTRVIGASPRSLGVWEAATGKPIITFQSTYRTINSLDVTPDGKTVISSGHTYPVAVWGLTTGEQELVLKGGHQAQVSAVAFSPDGSRIATASLDRRA